MSNRRVKIALLILFGLYCSAVLVHNVATWEQRQWDFKTFYYAARTYQEGQNPYDLDSLSRVSGQTIEYRYVYPPLSIYLFWPLTLVGYQFAHFAFLGLKCLALAYLIRLWSREFVPDAAGPLFLFFCVLAFNRALYVDVWTGNVSSFEQCLIWTGLYFFVRGRLGWFCAAVCASASWKLVPGAFLLLTVFSGHRRKWAYLVLSATACIGGQLVTAITMPKLFRDFLHNASKLDERGVVNPASLAFVRDVFDLTGLGGHSAAAWVTYGLAVVIIIAAVWRALSRGLSVNDADRRRLLAFAFCLTYALVAPRFKDYSYILLIPVGYWVISRPTYRRYFALLYLFLAAPIAQAARAAGAPELIYGYWPLGQALAVWLLFLGHVCRLREATGESAQSEKPLEARSEGSS